MSRIAPSLVFALALALAACGPAPGPDAGGAPTEWPELVPLDPILARADALAGDPPPLPRARTAVTAAASPSEAAALQARLARLRDRAAALQARQVE